MPPPAPHWLVASLQNFLGGQAQSWWQKALLIQFKRHPELAGRESELLAAIASESTACAERHTSRLVDGPSKTHVEAAARAVATYRTLLPWLNNGRAMEVVQAQFGEAAPVLRGIAAGGIFLSRDGFKFVSSAMRNLESDYGAGFAMRHSEDANRHVATITRCLYRDLFEAEGVPELARVACCTADTAWFDILTPASHNARFTRPTCMAAGEACCELRLERTDAAGVLRGGQEGPGTGAAP